LVITFAENRQARIVVWRLATGDAALAAGVAFKTPLSYPPFSFSPDERLLAAVGTDGSITVYDLETGDGVQHWPARGSVSALAFAPDGKSLAVSRAKYVWLHNLATGEATSTFFAQPHSMAWSPEGDRLATAGVGNTVQVWNPKAPTRPLTLTEPHGRVAYVIFGPGGLVASTAMNGSVRVWDAYSGRELVQTQGRAARFSQDGRWLGLLGRGKEIERRHVLPASEHRVAQGAGSAESIIAIDPEGGWLMSRSSLATEVWDLDLLRPPFIVAKGAGYYHAVEQQADGMQAWRRAPGGELWRHPLRLVEEAGRRVLEFGPGSLAEIGSDTAGPALNAGNGVLAALAGERHRPVILVRGSQEETYTPLPLLRTLSPVALAPSAGLMASVRTGSLIVTDLAQQRPVWRLRNPANAFHTGVAFSPDERLLAVGTHLDVTFLEVGTWRQWARLTRPPGSDQWGVNLAWSADGSLVACQDHDHVVRLFDRSLQEELFRLEIDQGDSVKSLAFSDDDSRLVAGTRDGKLHVWHLGLIRRALAPIGLDWSRDPVPGPLPALTPLRIRHFVPSRAKQSSPATAEPRQPAR